MAVAHELFHRDSRNILAYLAQPTATAARRELSILLCNTFMRAANLDWYERGDVWARVRAHRPRNSEMSPDQLNRLKTQLHRLISVDLRPSSDVVRAGRLGFAARWIDAFEQAGTALARLECEGRLGRGIREVLAHHILFHWNRLGITSAAQSMIAQVAHTVAMDGW